ncbi:hypothetical protein LTR48_009400, partial [Friedmanniomyces endolithicus]
RRNLRRLPSPPAEQLPHLDQPALRPRLNRSLDTNRTRLQPRRSHHPNPHAIPHGPQHGPRRLRPRQHDDPDAAGLVARHAQPERVRPALDEAQPRVAAFAGGDAGEQQHVVPIAEAV